MLADEVVGPLSLVVSASSGCAMPSGLETTVAIVNGGPLARALYVLDRPRPRPSLTGLPDGSLLVVWSSSTIDPALTVADVTAASTQRWAALLSHGSWSDGSLPLDARLTTELAGRTFDSVEALGAALVDAVRGELPPSARADARTVERIGAAQVDVAVPISGAVSTQLLWVVRVDPGTPVKAHEVLAGVRCPNGYAEPADAGCVTTG